MSDEISGINESDLAGSDWINEGEYQEWLELHCLDEMDTDQEPPEWLELSPPDSDQDDE